MAGHARVHARSLAPSAHVPTIVYALALIASECSPHNDLHHTSTIISFLPRQYKLPLNSSISQEKEYLNKN